MKKAGIDRIRKDELLNLAFREASGQARTRPNISVDSSIATSRRCEGAYESRIEY